MINVDLAAAMAVMERVNDAQDKALTHTVRLARIAKRGKDLADLFGDSARELAACDLAAVYTVEPILVVRMQALVDGALRLVSLLEEADEASRDLGVVNRDQNIAFLEFLQLFTPSTPATPSTPFNPSNSSPLAEPKSQHDTQEP